MKLQELTFNVLDSNTKIILKVGTRQTTVRIQQLYNNPLLNAYLEKRVKSIRALDFDKVEIEL